MAVLDDFNYLSKFSWKKTVLTTQHHYASQENNTFLRTKSCGKTKINWGHVIHAKRLLREQNGSPYFLLISSLRRCRSARLHKKNIWN